MRTEHTKAKLKIVAIGDSVTSNFYITSASKMLSQMWLGSKKSWYFKMVEKLGKTVTIDSTNLSSAGSRFKLRGFRGFLNLLANVISIEKQVNKVLRMKDFPSLILILAGHNELDWTVRQDSFDEIVQKFRNEYMEQLDLLCKKAATQKHKTSIVVFGLLNYRNIFDLRIVSKEARKNNPKLFPYYDQCYKKFASLLPENREKTILLTDRIENEIANIVDECRERYKSELLHITYSNVFSQPFVDSTDYVTDSDAWHPSDKGQEQLANEAWPIVLKELDFLGFETKDF